MLCKGELGILHRVDYSRNIGLDSNLCFAPRSLSYLPDGLRSQHLCALLAGGAVYCEED